MKTKKLKPRTRNQIDEIYEIKINEIYGSPIKSNKPPRPKDIETESATNILLKERKKLLNQRKEKRNLKAIAEISQKISNSLKKTEIKEELKY